MASPFLIAIMVMAFMKTTDIQNKSFDFQVRHSHAKPKPTTQQPLKTKPGKTLIFIVADVPTISIKARLFCRNHHSLIVLPNGEIRGSYNSSIVEKYGYFEFQSHSASVVRIKSTATQRYIGINRQGNVFTTMFQTNETLLEEYQEQNYFHLFSSHLYYDTRNGPGNKTYEHKYYLAIKQNGRMKNARKVQRHHKSYQFLVIEMERY